MADILQRSVARYGSNTGKFLGAGEGGVGVGCVGGVGEGVDLYLSTFSGTKTGSRRDAADRKREAYNSKVFALIT